MEAHAADIITALISATGGVIITLLARSIKEWRDGRKDEADRIAADRDRFRTLKLQWKKAYYQLVYTASKKGVCDDELPRTPDDN